MYKNESSESGKWIRSTFDLLFLNPDRVTNCFVKDLLYYCSINVK